MKQYRIPIKVLYINLEGKSLRGRQRNRWLDEVREDGSLVGGEGWKERVYNSEEGEKLLRTVWDRRNLHKSMELMNECMVAEEGRTDKFYPLCDRTVHVTRRRRTTTTTIQTLKPLSLILGNGFSLRLYFNLIRIPSVLPPADPMMPLRPELNFLPII